VVIAVKPVQHGVFAEKGQGGNLCDRMSGGGEEHHLGPGAEIGIVGGAILLVEGQSVHARSEVGQIGRQAWQVSWMGRISDCLQYAMPVSIPDNFRGHI
jgi:hypothetical protein